MNPRMMKQAMRRMGIESQDIDATEVIIRCPDKDIVIGNPQVSIVSMMGQKTFQIVGDAKEVAPVISSEDVITVVEQTGCTNEEAEKALKDAHGDLALAILSFKR